MWLQNSRTIPRELFTVSIISLYTAKFTFYTRNNLGTPVPQNGFTARSLHWSKFHRVVVITKLTYHGTNLPGLPKIFKTHKVNSMTFKDHYHFPKLLHDFQRLPSCKNRENPVLTMCFMRMNDWKNLECINVAQCIMSFCSQKNKCSTSLLIIKLYIA